MKYRWAGAPLLLICALPLWANEVPQSSLLANLSTSTRCIASETNICNTTINDLLNFVNYLKICNQLKNWEINYSTVNAKITITAGPAKKCQITLQYNDPTHATKVCALTAHNIAKMTDSRALAGLKELSNTGTVSKEMMQTLFKPIYDCVQVDKTPIASRFIKANNPP